MTSRKAAGRIESSSPPPDVASPPAQNIYEPSHVIQLLVQIQKDVTIVSTKVDRAIEDIKDLDSHVDDLRHSFSVAKGIGIGATVLIAGCSALVWWLVGAQLNDIRDAIYKQNPPSQQTTQ